MFFDNTGNQLFSNLMQFNGAKTKKCIIKTYKANKSYDNSHAGWSREIKKNMNAEKRRAIMGRAGRVLFSGYRCQSTFKRNRAKPSRYESEKQAPSKELSMTIAMSQKKAKVK